MDLLTTTYSEQISGTLSCLDRIIIRGTLPNMCYAGGMTSHLYSKGIKIFDYPKYASSLRDQLRAHAETVANSNGIEIAYVSRSTIRKEDLVKKVLDKRGYHCGLVHIISVMERCSCYYPWCDKSSGKSSLKGRQGKCIHYYFYFIDPYLGYGYIRVPTWAPFQLQVYLNGHHILASELDRQGIKYSMIDNAFDYIEDFELAQKISDGIDVKKIHQRIDLLAKHYCPVFASLEDSYRWSVIQCEYASDIVFKKQKDLEHLYDKLITTAIHTVKPDHVSTFLARKLDARYQGEIGNTYDIRIQGSRIKHQMGKNAIKMYNKFSKILRIETTTNDITFFKRYREVEHKDGSTSFKYAPLKKNMYSLKPLSSILKASNRRYLEFISAFDIKQNGQKRLERISKTKTDNKRNYKGFNLFDQQDIALLLILSRGEYNISGFRNKDIRRRLPGFNSGKVSRIIKRLRIFGLIKKVGKTYKYYLTKLGKQIIITAQRIKQTVIIPALEI